MPPSPNNSVPGQVITPSHSDGISPSHSNSKHLLSSPHSATSKPAKRPRILPNQTPSNPLPNLSTKSPENTLQTSSSSARRRSPPTKTSPPEQQSEDTQQNSDEEDFPLDLAKISSYEYEQVAKLNPIQLRRYEQYRRSDLKNAKVRRLILAINPAAKPTDPYIIAVKGLAKLFVGDMVETALQVKKSLGDKGALQQRHIREAYRRLRRDGAVPFANQKDDIL